MRLSTRAARSNSSTLEGRASPPILPFSLSLSRAEDYEVYSIQCTMLRVRSVFCSLSWGEREGRREGEEGGRVRKEREAHWAHATSSSSSSSSLMLTLLSDYNFYISPFSSLLFSSIPSPLYSAVIGYRDSHTDRHRHRHRHRRPQTSSLLFPLLFSALPESTLNNYKSDTTRRRRRQRQPTGDAVYYRRCTLTHSLTHSHSYKHIRAHRGASNRLIVAFL